MIGNYLYLSSLMNESDKEIGEQTITFSPMDTINDIAVIISERYLRENDLTLEIQDFPVRVKPSHLQKLVEELVDNACKFSAPGSRIIVRSGIHEGKYFISVINNGRGMKPEQIQKIGAFMQFERKTYEQQGIGLGLSIVKKITDINSGNFDIKSEPGDYTEVKVAFGTPQIQNS